MKNSISFQVITLICLLVTILSCARDSSIVDSPTSLVTMRSCSFITQDWVDSFTNASALKLEVPDNQIIAGFVWKYSTSDYDFFTASEAIGMEVDDPENVVFLAKTESSSQQIIGYFDPQSLDFCDELRSDKVQINTIADLLENTLGIIVGDSEVF